MNVIMRYIVTCSIVTLRDQMFLRKDHKLVTEIICYTLPWLDFATPHTKGAINDDLFSNNRNVNST